MLSAPIATVATTRRCHCCRRDSLFCEYSFSPPTTDKDKLVASKNETRTRLSVAANRASLIVHGARTDSQRHLSLIVGPNANSLLNKIANQATIKAASDSATTESAFNISPG